MKKLTWYEVFQTFMEPIFSKEEYDMYLEIAKEDLGFYGPYIKSRARIIDLGCGLGCTSIPLVYYGYNVTGLDIEAECIRTAKINAENCGTHPKFICGDIMNINKLFEPDSFDACISGGVLEHFEKGVIRDLVRKQLILAPVVLADMPVKTKVTLSKYGIIDPAIEWHVDAKGIFRNFWDEKTWVEDILKGFNVVAFETKRSRWGFDELYLVIKR